MALDIKYRPLDKDTILKGFSCGEASIDRWFAKTAVEDQANGTIMTTCAYLPDIANPAGFYALASVCEPISKLDGKYHTLDKCDHFPCLQLVYLAVHNRYQGRGIGSSMVGAVIAQFADIGSTIGLPHLVLVPINDKIVPFYQEKLGFSPYDGGNRMYLPLQSAVRELALARAAAEAARVEPDNLQAVA